MAGVIRLESPGAGGGRSVVSRPCPGPPSSAEASVLLPLGARWNLSRVLVLLSSFYKAVKPKLM